MSKMIRAKIANIRMGIAIAPALAVLVAKTVWFARSAECRVLYADKLQSYSEEAHALWQRKHDYVVGVFRSSKTGTHK